MTEATTGPHVGAELFKDLAEGRLKAREALEGVLEHLAERCSSCREALDEYPPTALLGRLDSGRPASERYEGELDRATAAATGRGLDDLREREEARALIAELLRPRFLPQAVAEVVAKPRFHRWGLASHLCDAAEALLFVKPTEAYQAAVLAVAVADSLDPRRYSTEVVEAMRCGARCLLARAMLSAEIEPEKAADAAERELVQAAEHFSRSGRLPRLDAELHLAHGEHLLAAGQLRWALDHLETLRSHEGVRASWDLGLRYLSLVAAALRLGGHSESAARAYGELLEAAVEEAPGALGEAWERHLRLERVEALLRADRYQEAEGALREEEARLGVSDEPRHRASRRWLEALTAAGRGRIEEAHEGFLAARSQILELGEARKAAQVTMDHLALCLREEDRERLAEALGTIPELYRTPDLFRWARWPLLRLQKRAWHDELTAEDAEEAREILANPGPKGGEAEPRGSVH